MKFSYKAINEMGNTVSGAIEADSMDHARQLIGEKGYIPSSISQAGSGKDKSSGLSLGDRLTPIKIQDLILFTKQLRTMLRAGVSVIQLFGILEEQTENPRFKKVIIRMRDDIREGRSLVEAFRKHPGVFSDLYCSMIQAGETSGALPEVLARLVYLIEHEHKIKSDIKSALQYPMIVCIFLGIAFFVLLTVVVPKFIKIFESAKIQLPLPTLICDMMYRFLLHYWPFLLVGTVGLVVGLVYYVKTPQGRFVWDSFMLRIPIFGPLFGKAAMSRFASIFAILQSSGVAVLDAMKILSGTIGNAAISRQFDRIRDKLEEGHGISGPLRSAKYFTPMVISMIAIGEESGNLDEMLREVSSHYDDEVDYAMKRLSEMIGPILMIGLSAVVGFFAMAIFLPMWDLTKMVK
jgi:type IV pilus assembly protein PilC